MNREIKFRAWNGKEMRYNVNINDGKPVRKGHQWFNESNDIHDSNPMQFTGMNDKNGTDIYEGDILKWEHGDGNGVTDCGRGINPVGYDISTAKFGLFNGDDFTHIGLDVFMFDLGKLEVIGNIYETK